MFYPLAVYIGWRYTRAKRRNHFISFISLSSMVGMALGITALITVLSVMNGFQQEIRARILDVTAHANILGIREPIADWQTLQTLVNQQPAVTASAPFITAEGMVSQGGQVSGAVIQGVLPDQEVLVSQLEHHLTAGRLEDLQPGGFGLIIGSALATQVNAQLGDSLTVITPQPAVTPLGIEPRFRRFTIVGIFHSNMYQYDRHFAFIHLQDAKALFRLSGVTGLRLQLTEPLHAPRLALEVQRALPPAGYLVRNWTQEHATFFRAVQIEKTAMFVILTLIVAVAAFNLVSTLVMVVTDKQADIAILRTLGASPWLILLIFVVQGTTIGLIGTALGVVGGVSLALHVSTVVGALEAALGFKFLAPDVYLITDLPSQVLWQDVTTIALTAFGLALVATLYPAYRAAATQPARALRYE